MAFRNDQWVRGSYSKDSMWHLRRGHFYHHYTATQCGHMVNEKLMQEYYGKNPIGPICPVCEIYAKHIALAHEEVRKYKTMKRQQEATETP